MTGALAATLLLAAAAHAQTVTTTFDSGDEGWSVSGRRTLSPSGGNPGAYLNASLTDVFGVDIRNFSNPAFLGDLSVRGGQIRFSVDVRVESLTTLFGAPIGRELVLELVDETPSSGGAPFVSVFVTLGIIEGPAEGEPAQWIRYESPAFDPTSVTLPAGWSGTGAENEFFEPILPSDRTFASVVSSVDEVRFTTLVPGFFFGFSNAEVDVDNPTIEVVGAEPSCPTCAADFDQDGGVTPGDVAAFFTAFEAGEACGDVDQDGGVTPGDVAAFFDVFEGGGC
jgi:hypothetical protein